MRRGKKIELYLVHGTANSSVIASFPNWSGKALKIPREEVMNSSLEEIQSTGVYFLFCGQKEVYIGEAENLWSRLKGHLRDYPQKEPFYWNVAILFIGENLNKTLIRYLEDRLVTIARKAKRFQVLTKNTYKVLPSAPDKDSMEEFIDNIKILLPFLGFRPLEYMPVRNPISVKGEIKIEDTSKWTLKAKGVEGMGIKTDAGFRLLSGAQINQKLGTSLSPKLREQREILTTEGKIKDFITMEDLDFSSIHQATCFIVGYNLSGSYHWKNEAGKTWKEIHG